MPPSVLFFFLCFTLSVCVGTAKIQIVDPLPTIGWPFLHVGVTVDRITPYCVLSISTCNEKRCIDSNGVNNIVKDEWYAHEETVNENTSFWWMRLSNLSNPINTTVSCQEGRYILDSQTIEWSLAQSTWGEEGKRNSPVFVITTPFSEVTPVTKTNTLCVLSKKRPQLVYSWHVLNCEQKIIALTFLSATKRGYLTISSMHPRTGESVRIFTLLGGSEVVSNYSAAYQWQGVPPIIVDYLPMDTTDSCLIERRVIDTDLTLVCAQRHKDHEEAPGDSADVDRIKQVFAVYGFITTKLDMLALAALFMCCQFSSLVLATRKPQQVGGHNKKTLESVFRFCSFVLFFLYIHVLTPRTIWVTQLVTTCVCVFYYFKYFANTPCCQKNNWGQRCCFKTKRPAAAFIVVSSFSFLYLFDVFLLFTLSCINLFTLPK
jgi:hypothetical protein